MSIHGTQTRRSPHSTRGVRRSTLRRLRVLIVEDVEENRLLLQELFAENGYETMVAQNGLEALRRLQSSPADLIVADAMMPKMDGFQLCKEVRSAQATRSLPFVMYTGNYIDPADEEFAREIGVDRYVVKTGGVDPLVEAVNDLAEEHYGPRPRPTGGGARIEDRAFLEQHHAIIIRKLEEKMGELEAYARTLEKKNREIQASENRYRRLFNSVSIGIFLIDRTTGRVVDANRQGTELLGYSLHELLALDRFPAVDEASFTQNVLAQSGASVAEATLLTKGGNLCHVEIGAGPLTEPDSERLIIYVRDVTERVRMRSQLEQSEKMGLMGRIAAGIAHEIRNPLSAITINLQYLQQKFGADLQLRQSVQDALEAAQRVATVVDNTLSLARVSPSTFRRVAPAELVAHVLQFVKASAREKTVRIEVHDDPEVPPVLADAHQVHQVLLNVIQNALEASPAAGEVRIATGVTGEDGPPRGPWVSITVEDDGPGIPPEQQKRLFEQFYTTKTGGTGIGLALSRELMQRQNGDIVIDSRAGEGTTVTLLFPPARS
jgi:PAS domain S-box-containing protein